MSVQGVTALVTAITALVVAVGNVAYQIRTGRKQAGK